jgi:hypothetical protein
VCLSLQWGPFEEGADRSGRLVRVTEKSVAFLAERANAPTAHERIQIQTKGVTWPRGVQVVQVRPVCNTYDLIAAEYFHPPGGASQ